MSLLYLTSLDVLCRRTCCTWPLSMCCRCARCTWPLSMYCVDAPVVLDLGRCALSTMRSLRLTSVDVLFRCAHCTWPLLMRSFDAFIVLDVLFRRCAHCTWPLSMGSFDALIVLDLCRHTCCTWPWLCWQCRWEVCLQDACWSYRHQPLTNIVVALGGGARLLENG